MYNLLYITYIYIEKKYKNYIYIYYIYMLFFGGLSIVFNNTSYLSVHGQNLYSRDHPGRHIATSSHVYLTACHGHFIKQNQSI